MKEKPPVSAMCLTYGRPHLLEEAIESFLRQDYTGAKELLVLNDFPKQTLRFEHPEVKIINVGKRFHSVGEKRNACAALASYDMLMVWDDDDIYLPHRITFSMAKMNAQRGYFKPNKAFMLNNGVLSGPETNIFHSSAAFTRKLFNRVQGYPHIGSGQDVGLEQAIARIYSNKNYAITDAAEIFYLYRWHGTGSYHLSAFGGDKPGEVRGNRKVADYVHKQIAAGKVRVGEIELKPEWRQDYAALVEKYLKKLAA
jgi:hypothetical protein